MFLRTALAALLSLPIIGWSRDQAPPPRPAGERLYSIPGNEKVPHEIYASEWSQRADVDDWGSDAIGIAEAWKSNKGAGVVVAVLDTGADLDHRDLKDRIVSAKDYTRSRSGVSDVNGHGTHCAGVVAASENGTGMRGGAPLASLVIKKVLDDRGWGTSSGIAAAIDDCIKERVDVISMSLGSESDDEIIRPAVERAMAAGIIVVAAAGNSGPREGTVDWPGAIPGVICVAATDRAGKVASFSGRGPQVVVAAPGVDVQSCYPGDRFARMSGTSMATPKVAAVAALYVGDCRLRNVKPTAAEFRSLIQTHSYDIAPKGRDTSSGYGLIQPGKMMGQTVVQPPTKDAWTIEIPAEFRGRPIKRIVIEFDK